MNVQNKLRENKNLTALHQTRDSWFCQRIKHYITIQHTILY